MPKKPTPTSPKPTLPADSLTFQIRQELDPDTDEPIEFGCFSRNWDHEQELDELMDSLEAGRLNDKQALLHAQKLLAKYPGNLEIQNYLANRLWALEMRDEATDVWAKAYSQASALIPKGYQGQIIWFEIDNRPFLRVAYGYLLGLIDRKEAKAAQALAKKMLAWCPSDNLGVRMRMGDISLMLGDTRTAKKHFLNEAQYSPAHWYQAGQIAFREGDYVSACTYIRRGIAANPYIAEGLTGRTVLTEHLYWHGSNRDGAEWAADYLNAPICDWSSEEVDFVDWVFNSAAVLKERAKLMELHEGLTYERDPDRRSPFAEKSAYFVDSITDTLSKKIVRQVRNRFNKEIWPWERAVQM
jgi:tetratricopeptide (TPR) repeat protein